jgi:beta-1,4-N-acetylglucosaminyltransferase
MSGKRRLKIALVCSHGGHLTEMKALWPAFSGHECFLITYRCERTEKLTFVQRKYLLENIGKNVWRMAKAFVQAVVILLQERPDIILSTGSEIAIPFLWLGKVVGAKTVYVESWCRIRTRSGTGPLVYPVADLFLVQWCELLRAYGPKARYEGGLV